MFPGGSNFENELYQNVPSMAMMMTMYTPTFGNGAFVIQPASPGKVQTGFPSLPYFPLEAVIYQQQSSNPMVQPTNIGGGTGSNQQVIKGQSSIKDDNGNTIYQAGFFPEGV